MRFLEYLFFKYYNWAIKVGEGDIPATTSVLCISFCISMYIIDFVVFFLFFISPKSIFDHTYLYLFVISAIASIVVLYFLLATGEKDKLIMEKHREEWTGKKNLGAVLFPITAILIYGIELFIKMLMNRGAL